MCRYIHTYNIYIYIIIYKYTYMYHVCMSTYIYTHIYIYIHTCVYHSLSLSLFLFIYMSRTYGCDSLTHTHSLGETNTPALLPVADVFTGALWFRSIGRPRAKVWGLVEAWMAASWARSRLAPVDPWGLNQQKCWYYGDNISVDISIL